jgi:beta-phosphoglucomutase
MVQAVLLEFEGVIADTRDARCTALLDSVREEGVVLTADEYADHCATLPVREAVRAALTLRSLGADDTLVEITALKAERRFSGLLETGVSLCDGARTFIDALQGQARLGIVSRAARREIDPVLALAGIEHAFEFVIADDDAFAPKPSPAAYLGALDRLARRRSIVVKNVIALEDGPVGIRAAKAAGLRCAAVGSIPMHLALDADALLPDLSGQTLVSIDALTAGATTAER